MSLDQAIAEYLAQRLPDARDVRVAQLQRIPGGASRETWSLDAAWHDGAGGEHSQGFIIRRDPTSSLVDSERRLEFAFYRSFEQSSVPVPRAFWLETDSQFLERPFTVMERIDGCEAQAQALVDGPYAAHRTALGRRLYEILADIASTPIDGLAAREVVDVPAPAACWRRELDYWEHIIDVNEVEPQPIMRAGIRWLRRHPPPSPPRVCVVHGDYRTGNFLYREDRILGILDWEMGHFGDPHEDLAWSFLPTWFWAKDGKVGGLLDRDDAIRIWEARSGVRVNPEALHWWDVFSNVKAQGIWLTSAKEFGEGRSSDLLMAFTSYWLINSQDKFLLQALGRLA